MRSAYFPISFRDQVLSSVTISSCLVLGISLFTDLGAISLTALFTLFIIISLVQWQISFYIHSRLSRYSSNVKKLFFYFGLTIITAFLWALMTVPATEILAGIALNPPEITINMTLLVIALTTFLFGFVHVASKDKNIKDIKAKSKELDIYYANLLENIQDVIMVVNMVGEIEYATPSIKEITGYTREEAIGKNTPWLVHKDDQERILKEFSDFLESDKNYERLKYRMVRKDGEIKNAEIKVVNGLLIPGIEGFIISLRVI